MKKMRRIYKITVLNVSWISFRIKKIIWEEYSMISFLKKKNIEISVKRYLIDALGALDI